MRLLFQLGVSRTEATSLLNRYAGTARPVETPKVALSASDTQKEWDRFISADQSLEALEYLFRRGFDEPIRVIDRYDLRVADEGRWAQRLLLPFKDADVVETFAGRAWRDDLAPKYLMYGNPGVYAPRKPRTVTVICEGPLDALKICAATEALDVSAIALAGKQLTSSKLLKLRTMLAGSRVLFCPDSDVTVGEAYRIKSELAGALGFVYKPLLRLPMGYKDPAEMPMESVTTWIKDAISDAEKA